MARFGIPRRSFGVNDNERTLNWRRGLFRVWVLASVAWIMGWAVFLTIQGVQGQISTSGDFLEIPILLIGPPVALLVFGVAAGWAFRGFRTDESASGPP